MPPKKAKANAFPTRTLVLDNGAYTIKAGFSSTNGPEPTYDDCRVIQNCIARSGDKRLYVAADLDKCDDFGGMSYRRPVEKGYLVNWELEKGIWDYSFFENNAVLKCDPHETNLVLTEAPNCPQQLQTWCDQMVFEEFEFASYYRCLAPTLNAYTDTVPLFNDPEPSNSAPHIPAEVLLVIDTGYSHMTVTPLYRGRPIQPAIRRLTIGGLFITNLMREQFSMRKLNLVNEWHLVNEIKEDVCYVSQDFNKDMDTTWKGGKQDPRTVDTSIVVDYVLPDYQTRKRGFARPHDPDAANKTRLLGPPKGPREAILTIGNERFAAPELLFRPSDVGSKEAGLPEVIMQSLDALPEALRPVMLANVMVVGGNSLIDGFMERLTSELRQLVPTEWPLRVRRAPDPIKSTWLGGARMASNREKLRSVVVTRQEYQEIGPNALLKRFSGLAK